jgi:asparagine synthase (glutamine-hydrolysing)
LIKNGLVEKKLNYGKLIDYFTLARDFNDETIFKGLKKLKAATILFKNENYEKIYKYWSPFKNTFEITNYRNAIEILHNKFMEVARLWNIADTKISLCLSSGLDSQTLNYYLDEAKINFSRFNLIENNKKFFQYKNTIKNKINSEKIINLLNEFTKQTLNPFSVAHSSCTSLFQLYSLLKEKKFKFTLNGEGADELYGGYERYQRQLFLIKSKNLNFEKSVTEIYKTEIENFSNYLKRKRKSNIKKNLHDKISSIKLYSKQTENKILEFDQISWIPSFIQRHDFIGMHYSLEVRPPFLDHEFVEVSNSIPVNLKYNLNKNKIILRKLLNEKFNYCPNYKKQGAPSVFESIRNDEKEMKNFKESLFYSELSQFFNCDKIIKELIKNYQKKNHIFLWRLYILNKMLVNF